MSTSCAHVFCSLCIQSRETCPVCEQKGIKPYRVPHVDVIVQELKKIKQSFYTEPVSEEPTLITMSDVQEAQERQQKMTQREDSVKKECFIVKKGERSVSEKV
ncbi:hypothetical protein BY458DRAFT_526713 [Sporodiniella umbellata]|nr:hypothetical protein BY458DRAFT_526713 [Sporodiniella umbellata]